MAGYFDENLFLSCDAAKRIYEKIRALPIIDYHCHLDQNKIAADAGFSDIGELWLAGDHYKWRAMRLCGVDEYYVTGGASYKEKFLKFAEILPKMVGNAVYYWSQMELVQIFDIHEPLTAESAERIYAQANAKLATMTVSTLLSRFGVAYIATTDDPVDSLDAHGKYGNTNVCPTFRPDKIYAMEQAYLDRLSEVSGISVESLDGVLEALAARLDFFVSRGCRISDHGFERFPKGYATFDEARALYLKRDALSAEERDRLFGFLLVWLAKEYAKRGMIMQIHFAVIRNNNPEKFKLCGVDSGFDLIGEIQSVKDVIAFFAQISDDERPETVLYTLNDTNLASITAVCGSFAKVRMGAAWWFNDTVEGIRRNLQTVAEYSALGTNFGMLTDSRSFASYVRFDFFRRLLADYLGKLVEKGEYDEACAISIATDISYGNIAKALKL